MNSHPIIEAATHHGKLGDIIYAGPVLRAKKIRDLLLFSDEASAGMRMTTEAAEFLRPLLTSQDWPPRLLILIYLASGTTPTSMDVPWLGRTLAPTACTMCCDMRNSPG